MFILNNFQFKKLYIHCFISEIMKDLPTKFFQMIHQILESKNDCENETIFIIILIGLILQSYLVRDEYQNQCNIIYILGCNVPLQCSSC